MLQIDGLVVKLAQFVTPGSKLTLECEVVNGHTDWVLIVFVVKCCQFAAEDGDLVHGVEEEE